jgi:hypothetical protein
VTIDQYFTDLTGRVRAVTGQYLSSAALGAVLKPLLERDVRAAFYVDVAGRKTLARTGGGLLRLKGDFSHEPLVETAHATGRYFGSVSAPGGLANPRRTIQVAVEEGQFVRGSAGAGVVGETLELRGIQDLVRQTRLGTSGYVYLVDSKGGPVAYPSSSAFTHRSLNLPQVKKALASTSKAGSTVGRNFRRQKVLSAWATVEAVGWKVFVEQPESEAFAPIRGKIWRTALLLAGFVAAGIGLSILLARRLAAPSNRCRRQPSALGPAPTTNGSSSIGATSWVVWRTN